MKTGIAQHRRAIRTGEENSQVYQHFAQAGHELSLEEPKQLIFESCDRSRKSLDTYFSLYNTNSAVDRPELVSEVYVQTIINNC